MLHPQNSRISLSPDHGHFLARLCSYYGLAKIIIPKAESPLQPNQESLKRSTLSGKEKKNTSRKKLCRLSKVWRIKLYPGGVFWGFFLPPAERQGNWKGQLLTHLKTGVKWGWPLIVFVALESGVNIKPQGMLGVEPGARGHWSGQQWG